MVLLDTLIVIFWVKLVKIVTIIVTPLNIKRFIDARITKVVPHY